MRLGIDIGGTKMEAAILDDGGVFVFRERLETPSSYRELLKDIAKLVDKAKSVTGYDGPVGVCTPGIVTSENLIEGGNLQIIIGHDLQRDIQAATGKAARVANDANCFALSEASDGAGKGAQSVFGVIIGSGCGGGLVINGKLHSGANGIAGEWGHVPLPWPVDHEFDGHICHCGRTGCLETYISGKGFEADYEKLTGEFQPAAEIIKRSEQGDIIAESSVQVLEDRLGRGLSMIINIFDPEVIVLGGGLSNIQRLYTNVPRKWPGYVFSKQISTKLLPPEFGDSSGVRGAAHLWD